MTKEIDKITKDKSDLELLGEITGSSYMSPEVEVAEVSGEIPSYTYDDYANSDAPYSYLHGLITDGLLHGQMLDKLAKDAKQKKFTTFKNTYKGYCKKIAEQQKTIYIDSVTEFSGQQLELITGRWEATDAGISRRGFADENIVACTHPILPTERITNIDTGAEKMRIAFCRGGRWQDFITDRKTISSQNKIIDLSDRGISVTSENAKALVQYLQEIDDLNYDNIPKRSSVSHLGFVKGGGFAPYSESILFDGEAEYGKLYRSVKESGSFEEWKRCIQDIRSGSIAVKIIVAAGFASALVEPLKSLPFFVHLWSSESGTGKTVALMAAASIWGDPMVGQYIQTFNATQVGHERLAAFLHNLPVIIDELQLSRDKKGNVRYDVYQLAEGVGRTRGKSDGGIDNTLTWHNCFLSSGETPIVNDNAGAGAFNRVIEIECGSEAKVIANGSKVYHALSQNYGFAGKVFADALADPEKLDIARVVYQDAYALLSKSDTTEKQSMAAALIIAADYLANDLDILDDEPLTPEDIQTFMKKRTEVDINERAYSFLSGWIGENISHFLDDKPDERPMPSLIYGRIEDRNEDGEITKVSIIHNTFSKVLTENGFTSRSVLRWMKDNDRIELGHGGQRLTRPIRVFGFASECVVMKIESQKE